MALHHEQLCAKKSYLLGASSIYVALKICEQMRQKPILTKEILSNLLKATDNSVDECELIDSSKNLLYLA